MQLAELSQELASAFVARRGRFDRHFDNLVAALVAARVGYALLTEPEPLPVLRALRNLEQRPSVDGGNFDLRAERRFPYRHRHLDFDVVAFAVEERMLLH